MKKIIFLTLLAFLLYNVKGQAQSNQEKPIPLQWTRDTSAVINGILMPNAFSGGEKDIVFGKPTLADLDSDGDLDLFIGSDYAGIFFYENVGTRSQARFILNTKWYNNISQGATAPHFVDIDNDGDLDMFLGHGREGCYGGTILFYRNTGTKQVPAWTFVQDGFAKVDACDNSVPYFFDFDQDGDIDLVVGGGYGDLYYVRNIGNKVEARWDTVALNYFKVNNQPIGVGYKATPIVIDVNRDGKPDLLIGNDFGELRYYQNVSTDLTKAPIFKLITSNFAGVNFSWFDYISPAIGDLTGDNIPDMIGVHDKIGARG